jgi:hypothetical protein
MSNYSFKKIMAFIEKHKDECDTIRVGMEEDWDWTADNVWKDGKVQIREKREAGYYGPFRVGEDSVKIAGICGSTWATPVAKSFKDKEELYEEEVGQE